MDATQSPNQEAGGKYPLMRKRKGDSRPRSRTRLMVLCRQRRGFDAHNYIHLTHGKKTDFKRKKYFILNSVR